MAAWTCAAWGWNLVTRLLIAFPMCTLLPCIRTKFRMPSLLVWYIWNVLIRVMYWAPITPMAASSSLSSSLRIVGLVVIRLMIGMRLCRQAGSVSLADVQKVWNSIVTPYLFQMHALISARGSSLLPTYGIWLRCKTFCYPVVLPYRRDYTVTLFRRIALGCLGV